METKKFAFFIVIIVALFAVFAIFFSFQNKNVDNFNTKTLFGNAAFTQRYLSCPSSGIIGDVDGNGLITPIDSITISMVYSGDLLLVGDTICADVDLDGVIDSSDSINVFDYYDKRNLRGYGMYKLDLDEVQYTDKNFIGNRYVNWIFLDSDYYNSYICDINSVKGDIDSDGLITKKDADILFEKFDSLSNKEQQLCCFDVNGDGFVNIVDKLLILKYSGDPFSGSTSDVGKRCGLSDGDYGNHIVYLAGDTNDNGVVDHDDSQLLVKFFTNEIPMPRQTCHIDMNIDGMINSVDAIQISKIKGTWSLSNCIR